MNTVLFDLDGTLLPMDQDVYVKNYIKLLTEHFVVLGYDGEKFSQGLIHSTLAAMENSTEHTNEEVFWSIFETFVGDDVRANERELYRFYAEKHPTLCTAVAQGRNSRRPVELLREKGYRVVLATNPLFPRMATYQRMSWGGMVPGDFEFVTTYENSRRSKPNPAYFVELLRRLQLSPGDCLMVGNDIRDDMEAASKAGLDTYLVTDYLIDRKQVGAGKYRHGTFQELVQYVERLPRLE